ncbi:MAG: hypothetical protein ACR2NA_10030 [Solirubrobacterales bacterium]
MSSADLSDKHLADLHALAAEAGIERFRLLTRDELIDKLSEGGGADSRRSGRGESDDRGSGGGRRRRGGRGSGRGRGERSERSEPSPRRGRGEGKGGRDAKEDPDGPDTDDTGDGDDAVAGETEGTLSLTRRGHGFIEPTEHDDDGDIYISASQIRRFSLQEGDTVAGPWRNPRKGERHRALARVTSVNGSEVAEDDDGADREDRGDKAEGFEKLTPVPAHRRIDLGLAHDDVLLRSIELLVPLAYGQRVLVVTQPRAGRTTLLRALAQAAAKSDKAPDPMVLLIDERPEDETAWREALGGIPLEISTADRDARDQVHTAERALGAAKRRVENGEDVLLLVDSLSRLAIAHGSPEKVKPLFNAGRETGEDGAGSLTIVGTALVGTGSAQADAAFGVLATTENAVIRLDAELAGEGINPVVPDGCGSTREAELREEDELAAVRKLRAELAKNDLKVAARELSERLHRTKSNKELLDEL